jgi:hypothetical protein
MIATPVAIVPELQILEDGCRAGGGFADTEFLNTGASTRLAAAPSSSSF